MHKWVLLRAVFLILLLAVVSGVIVSTMRGGGQQGIQAGSGRTLFVQFVSSGGPIVWFILMPMSLVMVYLAVEYWLGIRRKVLLPADGGAEIIRLAQNVELNRFAVELRQKNDIVSTAIAKSLAKGVDDWFRMREAMFESVQDESMRLMRRIEWINLIGNVSPMVGLFGTVVGMIKLFNAIVVAGGQPQPAQLAEGISVALVTTFWGLLIAIPALAVYGVFRNRIETLANEALAAGEELLPQVRRLLSKRITQAKGPARIATKPAIVEITDKRASRDSQSQRQQL